MLFITCIQHQGSINGAGGHLYRFYSEDFKMNEPLSHPILLDFGRALDAVLNDWQNRCWLIIGMMIS